MLTQLPSNRNDLQAELDRVRAELTRVRAELVELRVVEAELLMLLHRAESEGGKVVAIEAIRGVLDGEAQP